MAETERSANLETEHSADLESIVTERLRQIWGYHSFHPDQLDIICSAIEGRDVLAVLPTGGGKSICYQIPGLVTRRLTVVVSPLIALMEDQVLGLLRRGVRATSLAGSIGPREIERRLREASRGQYSLLYISPERILSESVKQRLNGLDIGLLAIDEAHCISEWGHAFRPDYTRIPEIYDSLGRVPVLAVTATATNRIQSEIAHLLQLRQPVRVCSGFDRPNILFSVFRSTARRKNVDEMLDTVPGSVILYAQTRLGVEEWAGYLRERGHGVAMYHAGMEGSDRRASQFSWQNGFSRIMVATSAFGMGIDKPDVRLVIHDGLPASLEAYYQEAGRAGRDGRKAYATLLVRPNVESSLWRRSMSNSRSKPCVGILSKSRAWAHGLRLRWMVYVRQRAMRAYGLSQTCRRQRLLGYFGDYRVRDCKSCDVCLNRHRSIRRESRTRRSVLSSIERNRSPYGMRSKGTPVYRVEQVVDRLMRDGFVQRDLSRGDRFVITRTGYDYLRRLQTSAVRD